MNQIFGLINSNSISKWLTVLFLLFLIIIVFIFEISNIPTNQNNRRFTFGITYHTELRFDEDKLEFLKNEITKDLLTLKDLGVDIIRTDVSWKRVPLEEKAALEFDSWYLKQVHELGMKLLFIVKTKEQIVLYSELLKGVDFIQVTNEPNSVAFSTASGYSEPQRTINELISLLKLVRTNLPDAVMMINPVDLPPTEGFITISWIDLYRELVGSNALPAIIGIDCYPGGPYQWGYPTEIKRSINITRENLQGEAANHPIWILETGSTTYNRTPESQSNYVNNVVRALIESKADALFLYEAFDNPRTKSEITEYIPESALIESQFGIFSENRIPKLAAIEYKNLINSYNKQIIPQEINTESKIYNLFSALFRLIIPSGGPMVFSEIVNPPGIVLIFLGLLFRFLLGGLLSNIPHKPIFMDMIIAVILLSLLILFQQYSGTRVLFGILFVGFSSLIFLFLWSGTSQVLLFSGKQLIYFQYLYFIVPSILGIIVGSIFKSPIIYWFIICLIESIFLIFIRLSVNLR